MENLSTENIFAAEREKREADVVLLESTEGWTNLTERQQRLIKQSLYIQARAERGTDRASEAAIQSPKFGYVTSETRIMDEEDLRRDYVYDLAPNPDTRKYKDSQNHIVNWYCHAAIANLESEAGFSIKPEALPDGFFEAEYKQINSFEELKKWLEEFGFPAVIHVNPDRMSQHSFLALGHDAERNIVIWDKEGYQLSYRITRLEDFWKTQDEGSSWGLRKLRSHQDYLAI